MKKLILIVAAVILVPSLAHAAPERHEIKAERIRNREAQARNTTRNFDLREIQDPNARRAIKEIFNYLDLPHRNN